MDYTNNISELEENGYSILPNLYTNSEVLKIINCIENTKLNKNCLQQSKDLFAIRQLIHVVPELAKLIKNKKFNELISSFSESELFLTKAIYFDKPSESNWFVAYHQDLSISVNKKVELEGFVNWTFRKNQYGVQPPIPILEDTITIRIHLDDTNKQNGALKVIPKSHLNGIIRTDSDNWRKETEEICEVKKGGVMLMKPLTLHASNRTVNGKKRRVIHLELNKHKLTKPLEWLERWSNG